MVAGPGSSGIFRAILRHQRPDVAFAPRHSVPFGATPLSPLERGIAALTCGDFTHVFGVPHAMRVRGETSWGEFGQGRRAGLHTLRPVYGSAGAATADAGVGASWLCRDPGEFRGRGGGAGVLMDY